MKSSRHPDLTTRRSVLRHGATLAGAVALPMTSTDIAEAGPEGRRSPMRLAQGGTGIVAPPSGVTTRSTRLVGSSIDYAYAVKAGPWVFLNGHEAFDFAHGLAPEVEGPPGQRLSGRPPLRREADYLLRRMRSVLKEFGTDLSNAVRVDQYYTVAPAVSAYHLARFAEFGDYIPPSTSIIMERCFSARANIHTSMIALVPERGYEVDKFTLPGQAISASGYNPAVAASDFVFVAGNMAFRPDSTLDPKVHVSPGRKGAARQRSAGKCTTSSRIGWSRRSKRRDRRLNTASRPKPTFEVSRISLISWTCGRSISGIFPAPLRRSRQRITATRKV
jgi:hypothetical protein